MEQRNHIAFTDKTNFDAKFLRGRFCTQIIPYLAEKFGKEISGNLCHLGDEVQELTHYLSTRIEPFLTRREEGRMGTFLDLTQECPQEAVEIKYLLRQPTPLDNIGIFKYSREPGSHSYDLPDQIPEEVKEERYHRLMKIQNKVVNKRNAALIGKTFSVIVEGYHPESKMLMRGRYYGQCPEIDGIVIINDGRKVKAFGQRYQVKITAVAD